MLPLLTCLACTAADPVAPPPEPAAPARVETVPFSCDTAAVALGHPGAEVSMCYEMDVLPGVFGVMLTMGDRAVSEIVVTDGQGHPVPAGTPGAARAFLARHRVAERTDLDAGPVVFALEALGALPPGYTPDHKDGPAAGDVVPGLTHSPMQLTLIRSRHPGRGPAGGIPRPSFERAVLSDIEGPWSLDRLEDDTWVRQSTWALP